MKNVNSVFAILILLLISSCGNNSTASNDTRNTESEQTIDGRYFYSDSDVELEITISGNRWSGKTTIYGSAQYDNGVVKGDDLYESSGMVEIGHVSGASLSTSMGGSRVTLRRR